MSYTTDKNYWRSLDQLEETPEFKRFLESEFPELADEGGDDKVSRRKFLTLMGASFALAGLASCRRPVEKIVPFVVPAENLVPGVPIDYHTTMPVRTGALGLTVRSYDGRPIKIEGNPAHPSSFGKTNAFAQAEILNLYDPDRSKHVLENGAERTWDEFVVYWRDLYTRYLENDGEGMAVISPSFSSPTLNRLAKEFVRNFRNAKWVTYDAISDENVFKGIKAATGRFLMPHYRFDQAKVILSLDSDFLFLESENVAHAYGFADGRRVSSPTDEMNRLYVVESGLSVTGAMADHRLRLPSHHIYAFTAALALKLGELGANIRGIDAVDPATIPTFDSNWLTAVANDLLASQGQSIVVAGRSQPIAVHALLVAINDALDNVNATIQYRALDEEFLPDASELAKLKYNIDNNEVSALIILGGNPVFDAPIDLDLAKVEDIIHLSSHVNETSLKSKWHVPQAHFLESWGDARAVDGTLSLIQPLIEPLHGGKSDVEFLNLITTGRNDSDYDVVRETWRDILPRREYDLAWPQVLHAGLFEEEQRYIVPFVQANGIRTTLRYYPLETQPLSEAILELNFKPSCHVFDGQYANNAWLLENPDPISKLTWDNAALMSPGTAEALDLNNNDVITIGVGNNQVDLPVWIVPGHAKFCITLALGLGRQAAGHVGNGVGKNTFKLRSSANSFMHVGANITKTGKRYVLASTQDHGSMEGRPLVREAELTEFQENPDFAKEAVEHPPLKSLWKEHEYKAGYQWGMAIDLNTCIGCGACTVACQSENNIPVVGKEQVGYGREMHWIRVDRYFKGDRDTPELVYQPMACQHCEMAPCESVCPVAATVHDSEGLNVMVYNRCIGTRYCSNNCPYKVRRFNFFNYTDDMAKTEKMLQNPNVTVRSRGVMEKCTYCLQRINAAKFKAQEEGRTLRDGEVLAACQQACPTNAIVFGNILDPNSEVSKLKQQQRSYKVLEEYNLKTRTSYLAKLRNPNPNLEA